MLKIRWGTSAVVAREEFVRHAEIDGEHAEFYVTDVPLKDLLDATYPDWVLDVLVAGLVEDGDWFGENIALWYEHQLSEPNKMAIGLRVDISEWIEKGAFDEDEDD